MIKITESKEDLTFTVRVIPRSSETEIAGEHDGALKIKLKSPPVDGAANKELIRFLSKLLDMPKSNVRIVAGATSRTKRIRLTGVKVDAVERFLQGKI